MRTVAFCPRLVSPLLCLATPGRFKSDERHACFKGLICLYPDGEYEER